MEGDALHPDVCKADADLRYEEGCEGKRDPISMEPAGKHALCLKGLCLDKETMDNLTATQQFTDRSYNANPLRGLGSITEDDWYKAAEEYPRLNRARWQWW